MSTGVPARAALSITTYTSVYTVTTGKSATVNIRVVNRDMSTSMAIRLAVCPSSYVSGAPANADYIEPVDLVIPAGAMLEETGIVMSTGEQVVAYSSTANATVRVHGFET